MTVHGWVEGDDGKTDFPNLRGSFICWNIDIEEWCGRHRISVQHVDPFWAYAYLTKQQIFDFVSDVYGVAIARGAPGTPADRVWPREIANLLVELERQLTDDGFYKLSGFDY